MVTKPSKIQDLDLDTIVTTDRHDKDFADLNKRICQLEEKFGTNEQIADTLCVTAEKAVKMREMISKTFVSLIESDQKIKEALTALINKTDRSWFFSYVKRIGFAGWTIIMIILGGFGKALGDRIFHP